MSLLVVIIGGQRKWLFIDELPSSVIWPLYYPGEEKLFCSGLINKFKLLKQEIFHLTKWLEKVEQEDDLDQLYDALSLCTQAISDLKDNPSADQILEYQNYYRYIGHDLNIIYDELINYTPDRENNGGAARGQ